MANYSNSLVDLFGNRRVPNPPPGSNFNSYAAGNKYYGAGRSMPNIGPVSADGITGYKQRDQKSQARKDAIMRRLRAQGGGNPLGTNFGGVF